MCVLAHVLGHAVFQQGGRLCYGWEALCIHLITRLCPFGYKLFSYVQYHVSSTFNLKTNPNPYLPRAAGGLR